MSTPRFTIAPHGALWLVTDTKTGEQYVHLTEASAKLATQDDITTGVTPYTDPEEQA